MLFARPGRADRAGRAARIDERRRPDLRPGAAGPRRHPGSGGIRRGRRRRPVRGSRRRRPVARVRLRLPPRRTPPLRRSGRRCRRLSATGCARRAVTRRRHAGRTDARRPRQCPAANCSPRCAARTSSSPSSRATGGSRSRIRRFAPADRCHARRRDRPTDPGRLRRQERVPHLADVRRPELAGSLDPAVRSVDRQPTALRPTRRQRPADAQRRLQARRLADRRRRAVQREGLAGGSVVLPLRPDLRRAPTSAIRARLSATRRCPTSTSCRRSSGLELASPTADR